MGNLRIIVRVQFHRDGGPFAHLQNVLDNFECIPFCITELVLLKLWESVFVIFKKSINCLSQSYAIRQVDKLESKMVMNHTARSSRALSTISRVEDQRVSTSRRSWRSFCCKALRTSAKYWRRRDDARIYASWMTSRPTNKNRHLHLGWVSESWQSDPD